MSMPEMRLAADGVAYTYADFEQFYHAHARRMWEAAHARRMWVSVAATEHDQSQWRLAANGVAYTYADFEQWYGADAAELWERGAATEHSGSTGLRAPSSESEAPHPAGATVCAGALPRTATEHSFMQCVECERPLCGTEDLAFFWRANKQGGVEVHLMLKPENQVPATFIRTLVNLDGAIASWKCTCGFKFGSTRAVAGRNAAMTAFKSSSVMLCGQRFPGRKSQWPSIYDRPPFNAIEVRTRDTFFGTTPASGSAS